MDFSARLTGLDRADHALVVVSDVEMGAGGPTDDFPGSAWLIELLEQYLRPPWARVPLTLVFNGDTFDLLKTPVDGVHTHLVDERVALARLAGVLAAHPRFLEGLERWLRFDGAPRDVVFVVGNHDYELLFPAVQEGLRDALGGTIDNVRFPGFAYDVGDVHLEHGSQVDPLFRLDPERPFLEWQGRPILALPWAAVALVQVAMPLHGVLYPCDRARPLRRVLELLPDVRGLLLDRYWQYWTRDWLSAWWSASDPTKTVSWTMFRQVAWRLQSGDASVVVDPTLEQGVDARCSLVISGHLHEATLARTGGRRVLHTGCLRDEFALEPDGRVGELLPKVYAEVLLRRGKVLRSQLVEVLGDPTQAAEMPASVLDVREPLAALRRAQETYAAAQAKQLADEDEARRGR